MEDRNKTYHVKIRPEVQKMLMLLKDFYEIILYSELDYDVTIKIVEAIEKGIYLFEFVLSDEISYLDFNLDRRTKDILIMTSNRTLASIILIDWDVLSYINFIDNGIPITPYDPSKDESLSTLILLERYLVSIRTVADVR
jgi:TFIIF-interacting CTD phosphatase-like protein